MTAVALSIAGIDPSGGAGVFADIKTFSALGTYGTGVVVALTAQNTRTVSAMELPSAGFIRKQLRNLFADVRVDAIKTGMLANAQIVSVVVQELERYREQNPEVKIVVDPVMISKSGKALLDDAAVDVFIKGMLPLADLLTPNLPEAACLLGTDEPASLEAMTAAARQLQALMAPGGAVLMKGGHLDASQSEQASDVLVFEGVDPLVLSAPRINTHNTHGTGCTYSAAICALLSKGVSIRDAVTKAKDYLHEAIRQADSLKILRDTPQLGTSQAPSHGPVQHFHPWWRA